jgi:hypothetical protein
LRRAQEVADQIAGARGLPVRSPIRADVLTRSQLVELVRRRMNEETPPEEIRAEGVLLERLGLIESADGYEETLYDMFEQQVAGLYDPDDHTTYVMSDLYPGEADLTLWHEIVHALQDQNFHVGDRQDAMEDDGDRSLAYSAVCEGDATITSLALQTGVGWAALEWLLPRDVESLRASMMPIGGGEFGVPDALLEVLSFPYVEGVVFVRQHWDSGGFAAVDDLFRHPPESTEQVIHPEKYRGADSPVRVRFSDPEQAFPGRRVAYEDTLGEFIVRVWLDEFVALTAAIEAAEGWGGDRLALLVPRGGGEPSCAAGASPLDDRLWLCGAAPDCGSDAEVRLAERQGWVVWATVWDPADEDNPFGATGEAEEFRVAAVTAIGRVLAGSTATTGETEVHVGAEVEADGGSEAGADGGSEDGAGQASAAEAASEEVRGVVATDERGRILWTFDGGAKGVAAVRRDGRYVHLVLGPAGGAGELSGMLDALDAAVAPPASSTEPSANADE